MASYVENVSIWWRHHVKSLPIMDISITMTSVFWTCSPAWVTLFTPNPYVWYFFQFIAIYHLYTCDTEAIMSWLGLTEPREIGIIGHLVMNGAFSFATERNTITRHLRLICFKLIFPNTNKTPKLHDETQINLHLREYTRKWPHTQILWLCNLFVTYYHYANWPLANIYQDSAQFFCDLLIVIYLSSNHL